MSGITNPNEEYFKDGLWGWDSTAGVWVKLKVTTGTGHQLVDQGSDFEVVQPTPADLAVAAHGWDGTLWRKLPVLFGYSDRYAEVETALDVAAGDPILTFSTVPEGEIWVIQSLVGRSYQANVTSIRLVAVTAAVDVTLKEDVPAAALRTVDWSGALVLKKDDHLEARFYGCLLHDNVYAEVWGYKMKVAE